MTCWPWSPGPLLGQGTCQEGARGRVGLFTTCRSGEGRLYTHVLVLLCPHTPSGCQWDDNVAPTPSLGPPRHQSSLPQEVRSGGHGVVAKQEERRLGFHDISLLLIFLK